MRLRLYALYILIIVFLLVSSLPCFAWLYDGGIPQRLGAPIGGDSVLVAAPFTVASDSYATSFGAVLARGYGTTGGSIKVLLTQSTQGLPGSAIDEWTIIPADSAFTYYYVSPAKPVLLRANLSYALVFKSNTSGFTGVISYSPQGYYGWNSNDSGISWNRMAFPLCVRVDGSVVPEPVSITALMLGLIGTSILRRRSRI